LQIFWPFNFTADLDFQVQTIEETEETILLRDGNGAVLRHHKLHDSTPEHIDFLVKDRHGWEGFARPRLKAERRRIDFEGYRKAKTLAAEHDRFFCWSGVNALSIMHPLCGRLHC
jgi:uroporphyrinogen decarboxylase